MTEILVNLIDATGLDPKLLVGIIAIALGAVMCIFMKVIGGFYAFHVTESPAKAAIGYAMYRSADPFSCFVTFVIYMLLSFLFNAIGYKFSVW